MLCYVMGFKFHNMTVVDAGEVQEEQILGLGWRDLWSAHGKALTSGLFPCTSRSLFGHSLPFLFAPTEACLNPAVMLWIGPKKNTFREKIRFSSKCNYVSLKQAQMWSASFPCAIKRTGNPLQKSLSLQSSSKRKYCPCISKVTQQTRPAGSAWRTPCSRCLSCLIPGLPQLKTCPKMCTPLG